MTQKIDVRFLSEEYKDIDFTGKQYCIDNDIEIYYHLRRHQYSTTELRNRVYELEKAKREEKDIKDILQYSPELLEKYNQKNIELIKKKYHHNIQDHLISASLKGSHFKNCIYIALRIAKLFRISKNIYLKTIKDFKGLPHRQEIIKIKNNLIFINDSKATNFSSTEVALNNYKNIHWIVGGLPKAKDKIVVKKYKKLILRAYIIGKDLNFFIRQIKNTIKYNSSHSLKAALLSALREAKKNPDLKQVILLSPSAASFDQYKNFEHRGNTFKQLVQKYS